MEGKYKDVFIQDIAYKIPKEEVKTSKLENQIMSILKNAPFKIPEEFLQFYTGVRTRFLWPEKVDPAKECQDLAKIVLQGINLHEINSLRYCTLTRHFMEPATIAAVMSGLNLSKEAEGYDITNACLGMANGIISVANDIELERTNFGLVLGCEDSRRVIHDTLEYLRAYYITAKEKGTLRVMIPTFTLGSGTMAIRLGKKTGKFKLKGYVSLNDVSCSELCVGTQKDGKLLMRTYAEALQKKGIPLVKETILRTMGYFEWDKINAIITHQVGKSHQSAVLKELENIAYLRDFITYEDLGNIGGISMPLTAMRAYESGKIKSGDKILLASFASGLFTNCMAVEVV